MKYIIKKVLLFIGYIINHNNRSKILYYHDIGTIYTKMGTNIGLFQEHVKTIRKSGFNIVPAISQKNKQIQICFDDGWRGVYEVKDFFVKNNIQPTVFIAVELVGKKGYLDWDEIMELKEYGFLFQSHTMTHNELTSFELQTLKWELKESKRILEENLKMPIDAICFPRGCYSTMVVDECYNAGYNVLYTSVPGFCDGFHKGLLKRNLVQFSTPLELKLIIKGDSVFLRKKTERMHFHK